MTSILRRYLCCYTVNLLWLHVLSSGRTVSHQMSPSCNAPTRRMILWKCFPHHRPGLSAFQHKLQVKLYHVIIWYYSIRRRAPWLNNVLLGGGGLLHVSTSGPIHLYLYETSYAYNFTSARIWPSKLSPHSSIEWIVWIFCGNSFTAWYTVPSFRLLED